MKLHPPGNSVLSFQPYPLNILLSSKLHPVDNQTPPCPDPLPAINLLPAPNLLPTLNLLPALNLLPTMRLLPAINPLPALLLLPALSHIPVVNPICQVSPLRSCLPRSRSGPVFLVHVHVFSFTFRSCLPRSRSGPGAPRLYHPGLATPLPSCL